jgi:hypothetical protein
MLANQERDQARAGSLLVAHTGMAWASKATAVACPTHHKTSIRRAPRQLSSGQLPRPAAAAATIVTVDIKTQLWLWQTQLLESCPQVILPLIYQMLQLFMQLLQELLLISCGSRCLLPCCLLLGTAGLKTCSTTAHTMQRLNKELHA